MPAHVLRVVLLSAATVLGLTVAVATGASAQSGTFGDVVDVDDDRVVRVLDDDGDLPTSWVWLDRDTEDDDDEYDGSQTVYLVDTSSRISNNDIRVGSGQVSAQTLDDDESLESLGGGLDFYDNDGDGQFDSGDGLYYDVSGDGSGQVSDLDIHVAGARGTDGADLDGYGDDITYFDGDGDEAYGPGDDVYLDSDNDDLLTAADVGFAGQHEGEVLEGDDRGVVHTLDTTGAPETWAFLDTDGDGNLDTDEGVYLAQSSSEVQILDIRVANNPEGNSGSTVSSNDRDYADELESLDGQPSYFDADGNGAMGPKDTLYYDQDSPSSGEVSIRDIVLTGSEAGTLVSSDSEGLGNPLEEVAIEIAFHDRDGEGTYSEDDEVYLDRDGDGFVTAVDVQLTTELGRFVRSSDEDAVARISDDSAPDRMIVSDDDADGRPDEQEAVYLDSRIEDIGVGAIRLAYPPTRGLGSQVNVDDEDFGSGASDVSGDLAYLDAGDDGAFGKGDTLYHDLSGDGSGKVSPNDVVLAGSGVGGVVTSGDGETSETLASYGGSYTYLDVDGDGGYSSGDSLFLDTDDDGYLTVADVILGGAEVSEPNQPSGEGGQDGAEDGTSGTSASKGNERARVGQSFTIEADQRVRFTGELPVDLTEFVLTFEQACQGCTVHISRARGPPNGTAEIPHGWGSLSYRKIEVRGSNGLQVGDRVAGGYIGFELDRSGLPSDAAPDQVVLMRHDQGWQPLETRLVGPSTSDPLAYNASLPGLSAFVIATDDEPPASANPQPTGSTGATTPTVSAIWADNRAVEPDSLSLRIDDTPQTNATGQLAATSSGFTFVPNDPLGQGDHTVNVTVRDRSGLQAARTWSFTVGSADCPTPPRITDRTPSSNATDVTPGAPIEVTVAEASCSIRSASLHVNETKIPSAYGNGRLTGLLPSNLEPGADTPITAKVTDAGGNVDEAQWTITLHQSDDYGEEASGVPLGIEVSMLACLVAAVLARRARSG